MGVRLVPVRSLFRIFATVMEEERIFAEKANSNYAVCFLASCPLREQCLRWLVGCQMPATRMYYQCVNHRAKDVGTANCPQHRPAQKVLMARGMMRIFTDEMPRKVEPGVKNALIARTNRTYYFEYRNGERLIPPSLQSEIRSFFLKFGWTEEIQFDSYVEMYDW